MYAAVSVVLMFGILMIPIAYRTVNGECVSGRFVFRLYDMCRCNAHVR